MAWPLTGAGGSIATGSIASGDIAYAYWGTLGLFPGYTFALITRAQQRQKKDDLVFENGSGLQSGRMQLFHGVVWELTVRDDSRFGSVPLPGTNLTVVDMAAHLGAQGATYSCYVLTSDYDTAPKQAGERTITIERIKLIEG